MIQIVVKWAVLYVSDSHRVISHADGTRTENAYDLAGPGGGNALLGKFSEKFRNFETLAKNNYVLVKKVFGTYLLWCT